jgi:hypothetical protein
VNRIVADQFVITADQARQNRLETNSYQRNLGELTPVRTAIASVCGDTGDSRQHQMASAWERSWVAGECRLAGITSFRDAPFGAGPESILPAPGYGFLARSFPLD